MKKKDKVKQYLLQRISMAIRSASIGVFTFLVTNIAVADKFNTAEPWDQSGYGSGGSSWVSGVGVFFILIILALIAFFVLNDGGPTQSERKQWKKEKGQARAVQHKKLESTRQAAKVVRKSLPSASKLKVYPRTEGSTPKRTCHGCDRELAQTKFSRAYSQGHRLSNYCWECEHTMDGGPGEGKAKCPECGIHIIVRPERDQPEFIIDCARCKDLLLAEKEKRSKAIEKAGISFPKEKAGVSAPDDPMDHAAYDQYMRDLYDETAMNEYWKAIESAGIKSIDRSSPPRFNANDHLL